MSTLDINLIRDYLIKVGCKVQYPILVNAFKKHLCNPDPVLQGKVRTQFKDHVNRLATVNVENNMKFITLRPEFRPATEKHQHQSTPTQQQTHPQPPTRQPQIVSRQQSIRHQQSTPNQHYAFQQAHREQSIALQQHTPKQPPPPLKPITNLSKQLNDSRSNDRDQSVNNTTSTNSPNHPPSRSPSHQVGWAIEACNCNYKNLLALLREDPKLAACKDTINGYTALHWAAKFGNTEIIKLIAGTYSVPVNITSAAGYTPLHVAYMFNRMDVVSLLLHSYQANPDIRDHSGKRPMQYSRKPQRPSDNLKRPRFHKS